MIQKSILLLFCAFLVTGVGLVPRVGSAAVTLVDAGGSGSVRNGKISVAATTGFPGTIGLAFSWWPLSWMALDAVADMSFGIFTTAGPSFHLPLAAHGNHRHALIGAARSGVVTKGSAIFPDFGPVLILEGGYGYLGKILDLRVLFGAHGSHFLDDPELHPFWETKPSVALRIGRTF